MAKLKFDKEITALLVIDPYDERYEAPAVGQRARITNSSITTSSTNVGALRPGSSRIFTAELRAAFKSLRYVILANPVPGKAIFSRSQQGEF